MPEPKKKPFKHTPPKGGNDFTKKAKTDSTSAFGRLKTSSGWSPTDVTNPKKTKKK